MLKPPLICQACGRPFIAARPWQDYCSTACANRDRQKRRRGKNAGTKCRDIDTAGSRDSGPAVSQPLEAAKSASSPPLRPSARAAKLPRDVFHWHGLDLHFGRGKTPVLTLVADETYPHLYSIRCPDGWTSTPANISRAKDAAYGHARYLLSGKVQP